MELPTITPHGSGYTLQWPLLQIQMHVSRLRSDNGRVSAEVRVSSTSAAVPGHLHQARHTLNSTQSKRQLAKALASNFNGIEWEGYVEQACVCILERLRAGAPVIELATLPPRPVEEERLSPLLLERQPTLLFGEGSSGKSLLATYCAVLIGGGVSDPHTQLRGRQGRILYLDYETDEYEVGERITAICQGLGIQRPTGIFYRRCAQPFDEQIEELQEVVTDKQIDVVIVDSVGYACGGEPESADFVLRYFRALRSLNVTSLSIDHVSKSAEQGRPRTPFGSVYKSNSARSVWEVVKSQEAGSDVLSVGLYHRKVNNGRLLKPIGLRIDFAEDIVSFSRQEVADVPELADHLPLQNQLVGLLKATKMSVRDLAELLGKPDAVIRATLNRYKQVFVKVGDEWGLLERRDDVNAPQRA